MQTLQHTQHRLSCHIAPSALGQCSLLHISHLYHRSMMLSSQVWTLCLLVPSSAHGLASTAQPSRLSRQHSSQSHPSVSQTTLSPLSHALRVQGQMPSLSSGRHPSSQKSMSPQRSTQCLASAHVVCTQMTVVLWCISSCHASPHWQLLCSPHLPSMVLLSIASCSQQLLSSIRSQSVTRSTPQHHSPAHTYRQVYTHLSFGLWWTSVSCTPCLSLYPLSSHNMSHSS